MNYTQKEYKIPNKLITTRGTTLQINMKKASYFIKSYVIYKCYVYILLLYII